MSLLPATKNNGRIEIRGQTATELAIFGTILVFVIGILVTYSLTFTYSQQLQQQASRDALRLSSFIDAYPPKNPMPLQDRSASVAFFEDRQMPDLSNAFGIMQRSPVSGSASAVKTRHLYANIIFGTLDNLPRIHLYINGQKFIFTTANFKDIPQRGGSKKVMRGTTDYDNALAHHDNSNPDLYWKWLDVDSNQISNPENNLADIDGDLKEEQILEVTGGRIHAMDFQDGQLDLTVNDFDIRHGAKKQGIIAEGGAEYRVEPGTQISKDEEKTTITTTTTVKGTDIITRIIRLNPHYKGDWKGVTDQAGGIATGNCTSSNKDVNCFDSGSALLYVRTTFVINKSANWQISK
jgi:hypothetical protein